MAAFPDTLDAKFDGKEYDVVPYPLRWNKDMSPLDTFKDKSDQRYRAEELLSTLEQQSLRLRDTVVKEIGRIRNSGRHEEAARLEKLLATFEEPGTPSQVLQMEHVWLRSLVEAIVNERRVRVEITSKFMEDGITPQYSKADLMLAAFVSDLSPRVEMFTIASQQVTSAKEQDVLSLPLAAIEYPKTPHSRTLREVSTVHLDTLGKGRVDAFLALLEHSHRGQVIEVEGEIRFLPTPRASTQEEASVQKNRQPKGILLRDKAGQPTEVTLRAAGLIDHIDGSLTISVGDFDEASHLKIVDMLLGSVAGQDARHRITHATHTVTPALLTYGLAKALTQETARYSDDLNKDLAFTEMPVSHPYIYVDDNYGREMDHYPENIFPNDAVAIRWLMDRLPGLLHRDPSKQDVDYVNVGRGAFSWLDILVAKHVSNMHLGEVALPSIEVIEQWKAGTLPSRYDVGHKFEKILVEHSGDFYKGSEAEARTKARVLSEGIEELPEECYDIAGEAFVTCSRLRDKAGYWRDIRRMAKSLKLSPDSLLVNINMRGSVGWDGFAAYPLYEDDIRQSHEDAGLRIVDMVTINETKLRDNDQGMIVTLSQLDPRYIDRTITRRYAMGETAVRSRRSAA